MTLILHHDNCPDGFGSAWWLDRCLQSNGLEPSTIVGVNYGDPAPLREARDQPVFVVDFCYPAEELDLLAEAASSVLVLDHHRTAHGYVEESSYAKFDNAEALPFAWRAGIGAAVIDESRSGIGNVIAWAENHLLWGHGYVEPPQFLWNLQDRDLWRFDLADTADVFAAITSYPYNRDLWSALVHFEHRDLVDQGRAINRYRDRLIEQVAAHAWEAKICGLVMPVCASPYAIGSDVAGHLADSHHGGVAAYFIPKGETVRFGLRSRNGGPDCSALAQQHGGGGHSGAAGFEVKAAVAAQLWKGA